MSATVPGGEHNDATGDYSFAAGYRAKANHDGSFVWADSTTFDFASNGPDQFLVRASGGVTLAVGIGALRVESAPVTPNIIGGHNDNSVIAGVYGAVIGGGGSSGGHNRVTDHYGTVGGGWNNRAGDDASSPTSANNATVGGGQGNIAGDDFATVGGGYENVITGTARWSTIGGGHTNVISNTAESATIPGGRQNLAAGNYSFAAGYRAKAYNEGCFVWGDKHDSDITCEVNNQWVARAHGGVYFYTGTPGGIPSSGVYVVAGGNAWIGVSDRATKENFTPVDGQAILEKLAAMPLQEYNLKSQDPAIRHIGPVAQDFNAAFGYGESDRGINTQDADGVALAAIQGLHQLLQEKEAQIAAQQQRIDGLESRMTALEQTMALNNAPARPLSSGLSTGWLLFSGLAVVGMVVGQRWRSGGRR